MQQQKQEKQNTLHQNVFQIYLSDVSSICVAHIVADLFWYKLFKIKKTESNTAVHINEMNVSLDLEVSSSQPKYISQYSDWVKN